MNNILKVFLKQLFILAIILGIITIIFFLMAPAKYVTPTLPFILIFHIAATLISFMFIQKKTEKAPNKFINIYLANTTVKLILYLAILMIYGLTNIADAVKFIISFFILYVIFTSFEVIKLLKANRNLSRE